MKKNQNFSSCFITMLTIVLFTSVIVHSAPAKRILCLTKCSGFVHGSIPATVKMLFELGANSGFLVDSTGNPAAINSANLEKYDAIALVSTTGGFLNADQKIVFENYVKSGKGVFAIHGATDAFSSSGKTTWPFYTGMVGAIFKNHPSAQQTATVKVEIRNHLSTIKLPATLSLYEEWYNFSRNIRGVSGFSVLMSLDESTYSPGSGGMGDHPIAWYQTYFTSRVIYTGLGHNTALFQNQDVRNHFLGCVQYAIGDAATPVVAKEPWQKKGSSITLNNRSPGEIIITDNSLSTSDAMTLQILSLNGAMLRELPLVKFGAGVYRVDCKTAGSSGRSVPAGVYIFSVTSGTRQVRGKVSINP